MAQRSSDSDAVTVVANAESTQALRTQRTNFKGVEDQTQFARALQSWKLAAIDPHGLPRYRVIQRIGQGAQGLIMSVADRDCLREVAVKVLRASNDDQFDSSRFIHEAQITAQLEHPGIVPVHDLDVLPDGTIFYTMKKVEGRTLGDLLGETSRADHHVVNLTAPPPVAERNQLLRIMLQVCDTMAFAHARGVIHRDLKPRNLMIGQFGEVLVMDWGLAKIVHQQADKPQVVSFRAQQVEDGDDAQATLDGCAIGTPAFMSPEQARGEPADQRSDIFSLGVILYHCLTGESPYPRGRVRATLECVAQGRWTPIERSLHRKAIPKRLIAIVQRAMAFEPHQRYPNVEALAQDLRGYFDGGEVLAFDESLLDRSLRFVFAYRHSLGMVLLTAAVAIGCMALWLWREEWLREQRIAALRRSAAQHLLMKEYDAARADYELIVNQVPGDVDALSALSDIRTARASKAEQLSGELRKTQIDALEQQGKNARELGTRDGCRRAIEAYLAVLELNPNHSVTRDSAKNELEKLTKFPLSAAVTTKAISPVVRDLGLAKPIAGLLPSLVEFQLAEADRQLSLASNLAWAAHEWSTSEALSAMRRQREVALGEALGALRRAFTADPQQPQVRSALIQFYTARLIEAEAVGDTLGLALAESELRSLNDASSESVLMNQCEVTLPPGASTVEFKAQRGDEVITLSQGSQKIAAGTWQVRGPVGQATEIECVRGGRILIDWPKTLTDDVRFVPEGAIYIGGEPLKMRAMQIRDTVEVVSLSEVNLLPGLLKQCVPHDGRSWRIPTPAERRQANLPLTQPELVRDAEGWWIISEGYVRKRLTPGSIALRFMIDR